MAVWDAVMILSRSLLYWLSLWMVLAKGCCSSTKSSVDASFAEAVMVELGYRCREMLFLDGDGVALVLGSDTLDDDLGVRGSDMFDPVLDVLLNVLGEGLSYITEDLPLR